MVKYPEEEQWTFYSLITPQSGSTICQQKLSTASKLLSVTNTWKATLTDALPNSNLF